MALDPQLFAHQPSIHTLQVDPDRTRNAAFSKDIKVGLQALVARASNLGATGASRPVFLFRYTVEDDAKLREIANSENQAREEFSKDAGQTLLDAFTSLKAQRDRKLVEIRKLVASEQQRRSNHIDVRTKKAAPLPPVLTAPKGDPSSRPWTESDPLPEWDKDIKFFSEAETKEYMASKTFEAKLVYWSQDGNKQALASCRTQALGHCSLSESKAKPLSADEERKVRDYMMEHTPFKGPPKRTIIGWLQYETAKVIQKADLRQSIQVGWWKAFLVV